jgi:hypothetical protein
VFARFPGHSERPVNVAVNITTVRMVATMMTMIGTVDDCMSISICERHSRCLAIAERQPNVGVAVSSEAMLFLEDSSPRETSGQ